MYLKWDYVETGTAEYKERVPTKMPVHFIAMSKALN
jgi:hypothetical protein